MEDLAQRKVEEAQRRQEEGLWEDEEAAATASLASASYSLDDRPGSSASGGRAPLFVEHGRASTAGPTSSLSITIPGSAAARCGAATGSGAGFSGSQGSSLGGSLKVNAREFVPGGFASPALAVSPSAGSATAAAAEAAARAAAGLRAAANEFRPGGPAAGTAGTAGAAEAEDPLLNQFLSGQLIQANNTVSWGLGFRAGSLVRRPPNRCAELLETGCLLTACRRLRGVGAL